MHVNKVEIGFSQYRVDSEVFRLIAMVFEMPAPLGLCKCIVALGSLML